MRKAIEVLWMEYKICQDEAERAGLKRALDLLSAEAAKEDEAEKRATLWQESRVVARAADEARAIANADFREAEKAAEAAENEVNHCEYACRVHESESLTLADHPTDQEIESQNAKAAQLYEALKTAQAIRNDAVRLREQRRQQKNIAEMRASAAATKELGLRPKHLKTAGGTADVFSIG